MNDHLTKEGTKKFFEMMRKPNPAAVKTRERGKALITPEQSARVGKEPVRFIFRPKKEVKEK